MTGEQIPVLYHHQGIAVVEKRSGLASQPTRKGEPNLYSILCRQFDYVGLHHRLDTPASGLVLVTTERRWNPQIAAAFREKTIERTYLVAVIGQATEKGRWNRPVDGKTAVTNWRRLAEKNSYSILEASLETGRKHQIRRHAAGNDHPIIGDRRYGGSAGRLCPRLVLHASKLSFIHPATMETVTVESPVPEELLFFLQIP
jgi:23S rRNA-/tRNA-specific pseudouridylate synthase